MSNEYEPYEVDGVLYLRGSAGSLILACPKCGRECFRHPPNYFGAPPVGSKEWHKCLVCHTQLEPIRMDELESRWKPFWRGLGHEVDPPGS